MHQHVNIWLLISMTTAGLIVLISIIILVYHSYYYKRASTTCQTRSNLNPNVKKLFKSLTLSNCSRYSLDSIKVSHPTPVHTNKYYSCCSPIHNPTSVTSINLINKSLHLTPRLIGQSDSIIFLNQFDCSNEMAVNKNELNINQSKLDIINNFDKDSSLIRINQSVLDKNNLLDNSFPTTFEPYVNVINLCNPVVCWEPNLSSSTN